MEISVVIPALNEAACIASTLRSVRDQTGRVEIIVADGGSYDATREIAAPYARVITAPKGRSLQMNAGAACASGEVLLFLHADTVLPEGTLEAVRTVLADPQIEAGLFRLRFDTMTPLLRFYSLCTVLPWRLLAFGDRGLFVRRSVFEELGGFPQTPLFEDLDMAHRLHRRGRFRFLTQHVVTSARRFLAAGPLKQQLLNLRLWLGYVSGADPQRLAVHYRYDDPEPR